MHKVIDVKLTSVFSPICQALIHESLQNKLDESTHQLLENSSDLLVIRQDSTVIGYALFENTGKNVFSLNSLYFRDIVKEHSLGEYALSRLVKRHLNKSGYNQFLLAS